VKPVIRLKRPPTWWAQVLNNPATAARRPLPLAVPFLRTAKKKAPDQAGAFFVPILQSNVRAPFSGDLDGNVVKYHAAPNDGNSPVPEGEGIQNSADERSAVDVVADEGNNRRKASESNAEVARLFRQGFLFCRLSLVFRFLRLGELIFLFFQGGLLNWRGSFGPLVNQSEPNSAAMA